jgi:hypothetical protein
LRAGSGILHLVWVLHVLSHRVPRSIQTTSRIAK